MNFPVVNTAFVTQKFGVNKKAYVRFGLQGHNGIDYGAPIESDIFACDDGIVVLAEEREYGYGRHIRIKHDGFLSIYGHLQFMNFGKGDQVFAGEVIGGMGGDPRDGVKYDGNSTGTHLHFEIRPDTEPANNGFAGAVEPIEYLLDKLPHSMSGKIAARNGLNVRAEPSASAKKVGVMQNGESFLATERFEKENELWLKRKSLREEWIAAEYYGNLFAVWEGDMPEPPSEPIPKYEYQRGYESALNDMYDKLDELMK